MKKMILLFATCFLSLTGQSKAEIRKSIPANKRPAYHIIIPENSSTKLIFPEGKNYLYAAKLLQGYFKEVCGYSPEIARDSKTTKGIPIFIGLCRQVEKALGKNPDLRARKPEEFSIFPVGDGRGNYRRN